MEREDAEDLRRRLYAPGASPADVDRYRVVEPPAHEAPVPEALPAGPARRRYLLTAAVVVVAAVVATGVTVARLSAATESPLLAPTPIAMSAEDRADSEQFLADGDGGGIAAFLLTHRVTPQLASATRFTTLEDAGTGDGTFEVTGVPAVAFQGRATVLLVLEHDGDARWTTFRRQVDPSGEQRLVRQRARGGHQDAGVITTDTFRYGSGDRPIEVRVQAPAGDRWGIAVVLTD